MKNVAINLQKKFSLDKLANLSSRPSASDSQAVASAMKKKR